MVHVNGLLLSFLWAQLLQFLKNAEMSRQPPPILLNISTYSWYSLSQNPILLVFAWNSSRIPFVLLHISLVSIVEKSKSFSVWQLPFLESLELFFYQLFGNIHSNSRGSIYHVANQNLWWRFPSIYISFLFLRTCHFHKDGLHDIIP